MDNNQTGRTNGLTLRLWETGADILRERSDAKTGAVWREPAGWADTRANEIVSHDLDEAELAQAVELVARAHADLSARDFADARLFHREINRIRNWAEFADRDAVAEIADALVFELQELRSTLVRRLAEGQEP